MQRLGLFLLSGAVLSLVSGCSTPTQTFHEKDVHFKLVDQQSLNGGESYTIQITSTSPVELTDLTLYLSYPIKLQNGSQSNPFEIKGRASQLIVTLEKGQSAQFSFYAPINQVFGNSTLLDFNSPEINLEGYTKAGNTETPFEMGGALSMYLGQYK